MRGPLASKENDHVAAGWLNNVKSGGRSTAPQHYQAYVWSRRSGPCRQKLAPKPMSACVRSMFGCGAARLSQAWFLFENHAHQHRCSSGTRGQVTFLACRGPFWPQNLQEYRLRSLTCGRAQHQGTNDGTALAERTYYLVPAQSGNAQTEVVAPWIPN
jgi:hypothetical protein